MNSEKLNEQVKGEIPKVSIETVPKEQLKNPETAPDVRPCYLWL